MDSMSYIENSLVSRKTWKSWGKFYASDGSLCLYIAILDVHRHVSVGIPKSTCICLNGNGGYIETLVLDFSPIFTTGLL